MNMAAAIAAATLAGIGGSEALERCGLPPQLVGVWTPEGAEGCASEAGRLALGCDAVRVAGLRRITPTRWYVDLDEPDRLRQLDINKLSPTRLLIAERPLGEARFFIRCREG
jgi:hypothetical protein